MQVVDAGCSVVVHVPRVCNGVCGGIEAEAQIFYSKVSDSSQVSPLCCLLRLVGQYSLL